VTQLEPALMLLGHLHQVAHGGEFDGRRVPPLYQVVLLNDDYTPMEFVVDVLEKFFALDRPSATRIMLEVHTRGKGVCGVFTYEIAETKVAQVTTYARDHQHPLMCTLEEA